MCNCYSCLLLLAFVSAIYLHLQYLSELKESLHVKDLEKKQYLTQSSTEKSNTVSLLVKK